MNRVQPPRFGSLLLERFGPRNDALAGDLAEEWHSGRSLAWYWRQVATVVVIGAIADIRQHWLLAIRAIAIGWLTTWICWNLGRPIDRFFRGWVLDQLIFNLGSHPFVMLWATDLSGWPRLIVVYLVSGWVVARLHPSVVGVLLAFVLVTFGSAFYRSLSVALIRITIYPDEPVSIVSVVSYTFLAPLMVLLGGLWGLNRRKQLKAA